MGYRILGDVHTHTLYSRHAYSTIQENVTAAAKAGLEILGSTDHFSSMLFDEQTIKNFQFYDNVHVWPRVWDGVTVLRGCEVDILGLHGEMFGQDITLTHSIVDKPLKSEITLFQRVVSNLDYVIASVHNATFAQSAPLTQTTEMYVRALENPHVFILGHTGRAGVPYDLDEVLTCAKEHHKLIEINEHSLDMDPHGTFHASCSKIAERCAEFGVGVVVSSDAHIAPLIGQFDRVGTMLEEIHFPEELIMNRGREPFLRELAASGVCDLTDLL